MIEQRNERNLDGYGAPPIPWSSVVERLDQGITQAPETGGPNRHTFWLATVNPDGRPHVVPLGVGWVDDHFYFTSGLGARKAKNLERDPRCAIIVLDPATGEKKPAILKTVAQQHEGRIGLYAAVLVEGMIRLGDEVDLPD